jgi:signal transduction histidine kinase
MSAAPGAAPHATAPQEGPAPAGVLAVFRRLRQSLAAAGLIAALACLLALAVVVGVAELRSHAYSLGYSPAAKATVLAAGVIGIAGLATLLVIAFLTLRPAARAAGSTGRSGTSLRTRAFVVIAIAVLIPSFCLSALGVWAYYRSWNTATSLYSGQASYRASEIAGEIASVDQQRDRFSPGVRARLTAAIAAAYGEQGHLEGAQLATLAQLRETRTLPAWALHGLARQGYAIGNQRLGPKASQADLVAWRVDGGTVRYYVPQWTGYALTSPPTPVDRLVRIAFLGAALIVAVGLLGAWLLSRGVVRPVRRLAAASGRLAEGEAGVTVKPEGPRELRELATSFNDMNAKLTKAQETEQAFLLSVSHELKTPLTSIRGYAEGIGDGTVAPEEGSSVIGAESSRLERLVGDLLDSARMRKSAFAVRREQVDLAAVARDVALRYEGTARDAGLALNVVADGDGQIIADTDRVLQVVSNLVENAIRCTPAPGTITVSTGSGQVSVADTGRGLTSDDLPRAFERFYLYSRYGSDRPVGTGLGLAIVKELTEAMGGSISISSALGVGTAFVVTLPTDHGAPAPALALSEPEAAVTREVAAPEPDVVTSAAEPVPPTPAECQTTEAGTAAGDEHGNAWPWVEPDDDPAFGAPAPFAVETTVAPADAAEPAARDDAS